MLGFLARGVALGMPVAVLPSPYKFFIISKALLNGWRPTLFLGVAPLFADIPIAILMLLILGQAPQLFLNVIRLAGGFFILYLAWRIWRVAQRGGPQYDVDSVVAPTSLL
ncbi:MAG: LysE family translocator, partial [Chloroflexota bacterium]|nr:LysE family translocator [Chloroflexota bacterium]